MTLNAYSVLQEFCENETLFPQLIEEKIFVKLVEVCGQLDSNRQNLSYVLQLLNFIFAQFGEQESHFFKDNDKPKAFEQVQPYIKDICYNCIIILRSQDPKPAAEDVVSNQANVQVPKFGIHRMRAIE